MWSLALSKAFKKEQEEGYTYLLRPLNNNIIMLQYKQFQLKMYIF